MSRFLHYKVQDEITYLFPLIAPLKFENGYEISSHTFLDMWLIIRAKLSAKLSHGIEWGPFPAA